MLLDVVVQQEPLGRREEPEPQEQVVKEAGLVPPELMASQHWGIYCGVH